MNPVQVFDGSGHEPALPGKVLVNMHIVNNAGDTTDIIAGYLLERDYNIIVERGRRLTPILTTTPFERADDGVKTTAVGVRVYPMGDTPVLHADSVMEARIIEA